MANEKPVDEKRCKELQANCQNQIILQLREHKDAVGLEFVDVKRHIKEMGDNILTLVKGVGHIEGRLNGGPVHRASDADGDYRRERQVVKPVQKETTLRGIPAEKIVLWVAIALAGERFIHWVGRTLEIILK